MKVLVVGSNGQLGFEICKKLLSHNYEVYGLHRKSSDIRVLKNYPDIVRVTGDLTDKDSLFSATRGMDIVIASASTATPTLKSDNFKRVDTQGYFYLIEACKQNKIKQFIYTSIMPMGDFNKTFPLGKAKLKVEQVLKESGLTFTIIQPAPFMDVHFAFFGSDLPLNNTELSILNRDSKFMQNYYKGIKYDISEKGVFNQIGKGDVPISYITVDNVAEFHVNAIDNEIAKNQIITIGGPEELSATDIKELFEDLLDKKLKVKSTPPIIMKIMSKILTPFNINAANIMAMNYVLATQSNIVSNGKEMARKYGVTLTSARRYLSTKLN